MVLPCARIVLSVVGGRMFRCGGRGRLEFHASHFPKWCGGAKESLRSEKRDRFAPNHYEVCERQKVGRHLRSLRLFVRSLTLSQRLARISGRTYLGLASGTSTLNSRHGEETPSAEALVPYPIVVDTIVIVIGAVLSGSQIDDEISWDQWWWRGVLRVEVPCPRAGGARSPIENLDLV